jgi:glycosyltransferase involved in cell wall biosynthesis
MKLIIQIPCLNEEQTLPVTLKDLPKKIKGIDIIEYLIIDDGSTDRTVEVARKCGVHHIVSFPRNRGLAAAFRAGIDACLRLGADIIVNTDADNQYCGADIPKLIQPILEGKAEMVVGDRETDKIPHFSKTKKFLQKFGSWVVNKAANADIADTTSGFRAYSREAAMRLNVVSEFSYTLETIIQAGRGKIATANVPIRTNGVLRESRLFKGIRNYVQRSMNTIIRTYTMYRPLNVFLSVGSILTLLGASFFVRFLYFYLNGNGQGHIQSLIFGSSMLVVGIQIVLIGLVADLIANNRKLLEETLYRVRKIELDYLNREALETQDQQQKRKVTVS